MKNETGLPSIQKRFNPFLKDNDHQFQEHFDAPILQETHDVSSDEKLQYDGCNNLTNATFLTTKTVIPNPLIESSSNLTETLEEDISNLSITDQDNNSDLSEQQQQQHMSHIKPAAVHHTSNLGRSRTIETNLEENAKVETSIIAERLDKHQPDEHLADWIVVGESVLIRPYNTSGVISFVGKTHFQVSLSFFANILLLSRSLSHSLKITTYYKQIVSRNPG